MLSSSISPAALFILFTSIFTRECSRKGKDETPISEFYLCQSSQIPFSIYQVLKKTAFFLCKISYSAISPPGHSHLHHLIQHLAISFLESIIASLCIQSTLHLSSLLHTLPAQANYDVSWIISCLCLDIFSV